MVGWSKRWKVGVKEYIGSVVTIAPVSSSLLPPAPVPAPALAPVPCRVQISRILSAEGMKKAEEKEWVCEG